MTERALLLSIPSKNNFMKTIIFPFLLLLITSGVASSQNSNFQIISKSYHPEIHVDSAILKLQISNIDGRMLNPLRIGVNGSDELIFVNENGDFILKLKSVPSQFMIYRAGYKEVVTDTIEIIPQTLITVTVRLQKEEPRPYPIQVRKPVIYVYAPIETNVNINVNQQGKMLFTYPVLPENGWSFQTQHDGRLMLNNKLYNYLFWESEINPNTVKFNANEGFVVATDTLLSFLENSLEQMGFLPTEAADFITYWYPAMMKNPINRIHFLFNEDCNQYATLNISPTPSTVFRLGMWWGLADNNLKIKPQILHPIQRQGLTVIEWGGAEVAENFLEVGL